MITHAEHPSPIVKTSPSNSLARLTVYTEIDMASIALAKPVRR
jgi:hypothetical protein